MVVVLYVDAFPLYIQDKKSFIKAVLAEVMAGRVIVCRTKHKESVDCV